jgi:hypothetical protein
MAACSTPLQSRYVIDYRTGWGRASDFEGDFNYPNWGIRSAYAYPEHVEWFQHVNGNGVWQRIRTAGEEDAGDGRA